MKQWIFGILSIAVIAVCGATGVQAAPTNNFVITDYSADYYLGYDGDQRSTLKTVERITADFSQYDQNHGLERAIPTSYDGHSVGLKIQSVTDGEGKALTYASNTRNGNEVLRIGDADAYVHGSNTYVITYTQRDVTRYFADTGKDEFYWDTNGTEWAVPIGQLDVRVHLDATITSALSDDMACYQGAAGATDTCPLSSGTGIISTTAYGLQPHQNVTLSLGFAAETFSGYQQSLMEKLFSIWVLVLIVTSIAAIVCFLVLTRQYRHVSEREAELGTIVPEYLPPKGYSTLVSAQIGQVPFKAFTAVLIDLAVRHYLKIYQTDEKSLFKPAKYELELVKSTSDLTKEEQALLTLLFPDAALGSRFAMSSLTGNYKLGKKIQTVTTDDVIASIKGAYDLRRKGTDQTRWFKRFGVTTLLLGIVTLSPLLLFVALLAYMYASKLWPLTTAGLALRRYLRGLKLYISVAEVERLKMLQSPEGADKVGDAAGDAGQLVKLYERVLPYAVLFGQEKEWNNQLGLQYETANNQPDWYSGVGAFNAVAFGAAMSSFSATTSSYQPSSSSSSGGSGGGGFSGGGGGGGGGGGW